MRDTHPQRASTCLGIDGAGDAFKGIPGLLHKLIWKFITMEFTKASIEGTQIQHETNCTKQYGGER